jgi:hypothetical protein
LAGEVIYSENDAVNEVLVSQRHGLTGKPDCIRREGEELIPVERKLSMAAKDWPKWRRTDPCPLCALSLLMGCFAWNGPGQVRAVVGRGEANP